ILRALDFRPGRVEQVIRHAIDAGAEPDRRGRTVRAPYQRSGIPGDQVVAVVTGAVTNERGQRFRWVGARREEARHERAARRRPRIVPGWIAHVGEKRHAPAPVDAEPRAARLEIASGEKAFSPPRRR